MEPKRISSRYTLVAKVVLPGALGLLALVVVCRYLGDLSHSQLGGDARDPAVILAGVLAFAIVVVGNLWFCVPLKKVILDPQGIIVSNFVREVVVSYSAVRQIHQCFGTPWLFVSIVLKEPCQFGSKIWYLARLSSFAWFEDHPDTRVLKSKCGLLADGPGKTRTLKGGRSQP
jgi:hypothetical protein